jgi:hypothetical protein
MTRLILGLIAGLIIGMNFPNAGRITNNVVHQVGVFVCNAAEAPSCRSFVEKVFTPVDDGPVMAVVRPLADSALRYQTQETPQGLSKEEMEAAPVARTPISRH